MFSVASTSSTGNTPSSTNFTPLRFLGVSVQSMLDHLVTLLPRLCGVELQRRLRRDAQMVVPCNDTKHETVDRTSKHIGVFDATPVYERVPGFQRPEGNLRCCVYSPDGRFFAWASPEQVTVVDPSTGSVVTTLPADNVYELGFSHFGTYIITWQRPAKDEEGNAVKNLKVWRTIDENAAESGARDVVGKFVQKSQTGWNLQYTSDEMFCARTVTNEVQFYQSGDLGTVWNKLRVEGVTDFALAPGPTHSVAVFVPERKGQPAAVKVFKVPEFTLPVSQKTFYKGDKVQLKWNQEGTSLIVLAQTEVDKSNKSYYGETNMYLLSANGGFDSRVQLDKEGPIHDVSWSPNSKEFGVVYGYMPAKTTIFNQRAIETHSFNLGPRNTLIFSPHGRFVIVAGFGNLAGQMDIYDLQKNYTKVCTIQASNTSTCEWSPDGRHILTATTSPRLRVDNGIRIWHVEGTLMYNEDMHELYHVVWRPQTTQQHPLGDSVAPATTPHASALEFLGNVKTPSKPAGAYRPPGARGTATPLAFKREDEGGAAFVRELMSSRDTGSNGGPFRAGPRRREVPGAETVEPKLPPGAAAGGGVSLAADGDENLSKAALKNKKKREAKKLKDAEAKTTGLTTPVENGNSGGARKDRPRSRSKSAQDAPRAPSRKREASRPRGPPLTTPQTPVKGATANGRAAPPVPAVPAPAPELTVTSPGTGSNEDKKIRSLLKKLRAIDDLKMRQAGGEKLEGTQVLKIGTEEGVRKELSVLGYNGD
nr:eukaryotic translation initiation factor 2a [Quercus suber]